MNSNDRVRELRKNLGLTQADFGEKIGLKQAVIGQMEKGARNLTDRTVLLICEKYNVNEEWLRDGKGPIFIESDETIISDVAAQYHLGDLDKEILKIFLELPDEKRQRFKKFAFELIDTVLANNLLRAEFQSQHMDSEALSFLNDDEAEDSKIPEPAETRPDEIKVFRAAKSETFKKPEILNESRDRISMLKAAEKVTSDEDL